MLHGVCEIRVGECQVLKCTHDATIGRSVIDRVAGGGGQLGLGVDGSGRRVTLMHARSLEELVGILCLVKKEPADRLMHLDVEEEMQRAQVLEGDRGMQAADDVLQKSI